MQPTHEHKEDLVGINSITRTSTVLKLSVALSVVPFEGISLGLSRAAAILEVHISYDIRALS